MELFSDEDFKDTKFDPNWSRFDYLLEVARVAQEKVNEQSFKTINGEEKKRQDWYLKFSLCKYNAPLPEAMRKEENLSFKQEKSLNKNTGLKRKRQLKEENEECGGLKLKRGKKETPVGPNPPPDLPENVKQYIVEKMGGLDCVLVIQKQLYYSDVNPQASRLSMPFSQLKTLEFLSKTEAENLEDVKKAIEVCLLEPSLKETEITFKRWNMKKISTYVMTTAWNSVVKNNRLKTDDIVQVWSFRVRSTLSFALVKVEVPSS